MQQDGGALDGSAGADAAPPGDGGVAASVDRGRYLVDHVAACGDCHTPRRLDGTPDPDRYLAGVICFRDVNGEAPGGCLHSGNLTSDATGLADLSDAAIRDLFQGGVREGGAALLPAMPYWILHNLTEVDAASIVLYLRTVPAVDNTIPANDPELPAPELPAPALDPDTDIPMPQTVTTRTMNGRYLAALAGACIGCHTALTVENDPRSLDLARAFAGGRGFARADLGLPEGFPEVIYSGNITPHRSGIAAFSPDDVIAALRDGEDRDGARLCPPMPAGPMAAFGGLTDEDAADLAAFVLALAPIENRIPAGCTPPE